MGQDPPMRAKAAKEDIMTVRPPRPPATRAERNFAALRAEIARLREELAATKAALKRAEEGGADPLVARRIAELEEGQKVARGIAVEATLARSRAEADLKALRDAIGKARGLKGWLLRRAERSLDRPRTRRSR
jgi:hypothetical protein